MTRCLSCYKPLAEAETDFHPACSRKLFGQPVPPLLPYSEDELEPLAQEVIRSQISVTGVQPKLSLHPQQDGNLPRRFMIVGLWGAYILKPPVSQYPQLPEVEDLTLHLATLAGIGTVPHSLIRLQSGNLAYITRRVDRQHNAKLAMEDMCQLTGRMTEDKYLGSYEQIAKAIVRYSSAPGLDLVNFFEIVLFSFLTGNADMHLKNFSLVEQPGLGMILSPAYDLVATALVNPADDEELALTLNGKKKKITRKDFESAFRTLRLQEKQQQHIFARMQAAIPAWRRHIGVSFLSQDYQEAYRHLIETRWERMK